MSVHVWSQEHNSHQGLYVFEWILEWVNACGLLLSFAPTLGGILKLCLIDYISV